MRAVCVSANISVVLSGLILAKHFVLHAGEETADDRFDLLHLANRAAVVGCLSYLLETCVSFPIPPRHPKQSAERNDKEDMANRSLSQSARQLAPHGLIVSCSVLSIGIASQASSLLQAHRHALEK